MSVVIPTRNRRRLLPRTLGCVRRQKGVEVEAVVVDDGSDDGTSEYLQTVSDLELVVVRKNRAGGVAAARNAGIERASAPWVAFLDDDDLWAPGKLAKQIAALEGSKGAGWCLTGAALLDRHLNVVSVQRPPGEGRLHRLLAYNFVPAGGSSVVARTELVRELGGFDESLQVVADWDLWIRLALAADAATVDEPLIAYVSHEENMVRDLSTMRRELHHVERKYAEMRRQLDIEFAIDNWLDWIADTQRRSGRRLGPARLWLQLAARQRRPRLVARAALAAAWPGWVQVRDRQSAQALPMEVLDGVEDWLAPIRARESAADQQVA
jgi:glycosyltransferase involved in cell wall biosynthesis